MPLIMWFPFLGDGMRSTDIIHQHRGKAGRRLGARPPDSACGLWKLRCAVHSSALSFVRSKRGDWLTPQVAVRVRRGDGAKAPLSVIQSGVHGGCPVVFPSVLVPPSRCCVGSFRTGENCILLL